jgi:endonuclease YncB( thermonuclease family)
VLRAKSRALIALGIAVGYLAALAQGPPVEPALAADRDCADFSTQADAQRFFEASGPSDPHRLDGDGDGVACEDLPCPCASGGGSDPAGGGSDPGGGGGGGSGKKRAIVVGIADGDTIKVRRRRHTEDVRLIGIDTPEVYFGAECGGAQASASLKRMLSVGNRVRLIRDRSQDNRDSYDRLLRYVERHGRDVGRRQIRKGWASVYVFERPFQRVGKYRGAQSKARRSDRGVWDRCGGDFHQPL